MKHYLIITTFIALYVVLTISCKKKDNAAPASHTYGMAGMHNWHGPDSLDGAFAGMIITSFAIDVVNDSNITANGYALKLDSVDEANGVLYFANGYTPSAALSFTSFLHGYFYVLITYRYRSNNNRIDYFINYPKYLGNHQQAMEVIRLSTP